MPSTPTPPHPTTLLWVIRLGIVILLEVGQTHLLAAQPDTIALVTTTPLLAMVLESD